MFRFSLKVSRSFALLACLSAGLRVPALAQTHSVPKSYVFQNLHTFTGGADGENPFASLIMDSNGALYGTAENTITNGNGTIFKYAPATNAFTTLHAFSGKNSSDENSDGAHPFAGLLMDSSGNLYGTASEGGSYGVGTLFFQYAYATNTFTALYNFTGGADGANPYAGLLMDSSGALYGTAANGGANGYGTLFKYAPATNTFTTLYAFTGGADGANPDGALLLDSSGALYGTTNGGGMNGKGTIFKYAPATNAFTTLYSFTGGADGGNPWAGLLMDSSGNLYGTAQNGGVNGRGTIFVLHPIFTGTPPPTTHHSQGPTSPAPTGGAAPAP